MPTPKKPAPKTLDPNDPNPCSGCSYCCEYVAIEIDTPNTVHDFDEIVWFLIHKDVWVYIDSEDKTWNLQFNTRCEKLDQQRCGYYTHRPMICRSYSVKSCERYGEGDVETFIFRNEVDLFKYLAKKRPAIFRKLKERIEIPFTIEELKSEEETAVA